jgi:hypothetical protein
MPFEPGFHRIIIAPSFGNLEFAKGDIPTPHGIIHVDYKMGELGITLPRGVEIGELDIRNDIKLTVWHSEA